MLLVVLLGDGARTGAGQLSLTNHLDSERGLASLIHGTMLLGIFSKTFLGVLVLLEGPSTRRCI